MELYKQYSVNDIVMTSIYQLIIMFGLIVFGFFIENYLRNRKKKSNKWCGIVISNDEVYRELVRHVLDNGKTRRNERTGTGTISYFGTQSRYDLSNMKIPLLTSKYVHFHAVIHELIWYLRGDTTTEYLEQNQVKVWRGNSSREFLDRNGFQDYEEGEVGPLYGFQWRYFGGTFVPNREFSSLSTTELRNKYQYADIGVDQIANVIEEIQRNPQSRRLLVSAWNPYDLSKMVLPPCHFAFQFYVDSDNMLSCQLYQRSADIGLGVPFNIACYATLTHIVADICGLRAKELIHTIGDAHIYLNHVELLKGQISREPINTSPFIRFRRKFSSIDDVTADDVVLENYHHHPVIKMKMAI